MLGQEKSREPTGAARWPNLRHKYRQLALPAVVAAVMAEKKSSKRPAGKPGERSRKPDKDER